MINNVCSLSQNARFRLPPCSSLGFIGTLLLRSWVSECLWKIYITFWTISLSVFCHSPLTFFCLTAPQPNFIIWVNWRFVFIYLWHRLSCQQIAQLARGGILAKLTETWHTNIHIYNLYIYIKRNLVMDPSSFRMAMSFVYFHLTHPWWISMEATANVSSSVSPSLTIKFWI